MGSGLVGLALLVEPGLRVGERVVPPMGVGFLVGWREGSGDTLGRRVCPAIRVG